MTEINICKKCGRNLPDNYKYNRCESCRNKTIDSVKKAGSTTLKVLAVVTTLALTFFSGGKGKK